MNEENIRKIKIENMDRIADYRRKLYEKPILKDLFLEVTLRCNARCEHCGSVIVQDDYTWALASIENIKQNRL